MRYTSLTAVFLISFYLVFFSALQISFSDDKKIPVSGDLPNKNTDEPFNENELDDILNGFEKKEKEDFLSQAPKEQKLFDIDGDISLEIALSPENDDEQWDGLTRFRTELFLELNKILSDSWKMRASSYSHYDFAYQLNGRSKYSKEVLKEYEDEIELFEAYVQGSLSRNIDIKIGRQIVVWGKSDYIRVTDVLNPLDVRIPGLTDIKYLRLPVTMTRLDLYQGNWNLSGIAVHEHRYNKRPLYGSDFYFFSGPEPHEQEPATNIKNTEYGIALNGIFSGWDISFYFANVFDDEPHIDWASAKMKHEPITMTGISSNIAKGNWLLIGETAHFSGINYSLVSGKEFSRTDIMAGIEYSGFKDATINLEAVNRHVHNYTDELKQAPFKIKRDLLQTVFRISKEFMNETLMLSFLASTYGPTGQDGSIQRMTAEYDITDNIQITFKLLLYNSGNLTQFEDIGDNDRLFFEFKYYL